MDSVGERCHRRWEGTEWGDLAPTVYILEEPSGTLGSGLVSNKVILAPQGREKGVPLEM